jgi:RNA polymerase sigma-70 factor (ECF subfamily)
VTEDDRIDDRLMCRVKYDDDHDAFAELLPRIRPTLEALLGRRLPPGEVEDALADVFLRLWQHRGRFRERRGTVRALAATIARNCARDRWRRRKQHTALDGVAEAVADARHPDPAVAVEQADWAAYVRRRCDEVLATLPPYVRTCFELRLQGVAFETIAARVGRPVGSVAAALFRFRARMVAVLDKLDDSLSRKPGAHAMNDPLTRALGEMSAIRGKLTTVERLLEELKETPAARLNRLLSRVRELLADGTKDPTQYQSATAWAEVEDRVEDLGLVKDQLPDGLFRKVKQWLRDSRERLQRDGRDAYALNQLRGVEKALANAATS